MDERRHSRGEVVDGGPGYAYMMFVLMESLLDKLKLLNYDTEFTQELKMKYINRYVRYKLISSIRFSLHDHSFLII